MKSGKNLSRAESFSSWKALGNRGQGLPGEKPDFSRLSAIYAFDQNVEITVSGLYYPDQVFVRLKRISLGTLGISLISLSRAGRRRLMTAASWLARASASAPRRGVFR